MKLHTEDHAPVPMLFVAFMRQKYVKLLASTGLFQKESIMPLGQAIVEEKLELDDSCKP